MEIVELVKIRLKYFKCEVLPDEIDILDYLVKKSLNSINNKTNQNYTLTSIPNGLEDILIDKTVGEYLLMKKTTDSLTGYDFSPPEKQIQVGDTNTTYAVETVSSPEKRIDDLIEQLLYGRESELVRFRRLGKWKIENQ